MKIGIIGKGNVGAALAAGWTKAGHQVKSGGRGEAAAVANFGEVVVLATPWPAARAALAEAGGAALEGKPLLDCTNPLKEDLSGLALGHTTSAGEQVQAWAPGAKVVKVFNTTGANNMADPTFPAGAATMLYCGNDKDAKAVAARLATDLGFDAVDAGPIA
ncbi:MAG TPA: NAD(P)-binding domain-containing protein, partial [Planctomycetota bacterium]|nr:NAD(P)-binding domain-containing protein [Planctomycetota bacterium]